ncbi:tumor necrosis factor receptor superfamily member 14 isoform X4 [Meles meles]|uniref:tumor necrosis factor receptor superfamily member 14 isoform X4 n=1 Tax=Meles meles TaxID=9662 RepID=UPI001E69C656|nr:tumor necrosis factor receptor superfamily member 14 isoform X4 [Meles meles]
MEPPGGWEPPPCSRAPKPDALSQAVYLLLLGSLPCALAVAPCKEEEYPVGSDCCPKCSPGYRVKEACGELTGTVCAPCDPGTYTAHLNGLSECLQCRVCDPAMGLVTRRKCSPTENTVCVCDQGHFCVSEDGDDCAECRPHTPCRPGQRVQARGTERQDRVCEDCPPGTFSPSGTLQECEPWSTCDGPLQTQAEPGTSSSDVKCSSLLPAVGDPRRREYFTRSRGPHQTSPQWLWRRQRPCPPGRNDPLTDRWILEADTQAVLGWAC